VVTEYFPGCRGEGHASTQPVQFLTDATLVTNLRGAALSVVFTDLLAPIQVDALQRATHLASAAPIDGAVPVVSHPGMPHVTAGSGICSWSPS
jgi:hypothetical protein